jgi:hypothetical protein
MAIFGKTYSKKEKEDLKSDIDEQIGHFAAQHSSYGDMISDAASDPTREGIFGRGGKLRNEIIGMRKKKSSSKPKRKTCSCKKK